MEIKFTLETIKEAAAHLWSEKKNCLTWAFHGEMGSGKTTFIHALCEVLGVESGIGSPTYSIINEYLSKKAGPVYHMDWYRLKDEEEALQAGVEDAIYSGQICLIEWPDRASGLIPADALHIYVTVLTPDLRTITTS